MGADLLDVGRDLPRRVAEENRPLDSPIVGEVAELDESVELKAAPEGGELRPEQASLFTSARSTRRRAVPGAAAHANNLRFTTSRRSSRAEAFTRLDNLITLCRACHEREEPRVGFLREGAYTPGGSSNGRP